MFLNKIYKKIRFIIIRFFRESVIRIRFAFLGLRRPISKVFGFDRGVPIDRYYIEKFLETNVDVIKGRVLEIGDNYYTIKYGAQKVFVSDVLHVVPGNMQATFVGDLTNADSIPDNLFDCVILTQTLQFIYDVKSAIKTIERILKPGGVVLATASGISQISRYDMDRWGEYWRFTDLSSRRLFEDFFPAENIEVKSCGNVLVAISLLHGLAVHELKQKKLDYYDQDYQVLITIKAIKPKEK